MRWSWIHSNFFKFKFISIYVHFLYSKLHVRLEQL